MSIQVRKLQTPLGDVEVLTIAYRFFCFMWCNLAAENKKKSIGTKVSLIIFFSIPFRHQSTLRPFLLSPLAKIQFLCFMYSVADFCYNVQYC